MSATTSNTLTKVFCSFPRFLHANSVKVYTTRPRRLIQHNFYFIVYSYLPFNATFCATDSIAKEITNTQINTVNRENKSGHPEVSIRLLQRVADRLTNLINQVRMEQTFRAFSLFLHFCSGVSNASFHVFSLYVLVTTFGSMNLIGSFTPPTTNYRLHYPLPNNVPTCCSTFFLDC